MEFSTALPTIWLSGVSFIFLSSCKHQLQGLGQGTDVLDCVPLNLPDSDLFKLGIQRVFIPGWDLVDALFGQGHQLVGERGGGETSGEMWLGAACFICKVGL